MIFQGSTFPVKVWSVKKPISWITIWYRAIRSKAEYKGDAFRVYGIGYGGCFQRNMFLKGNFWTAYDSVWSIANSVLLFRLVIRYVCQEKG